ncbi:hypothetical protein ASG43_21605 [Aureimonas sp. Leaf454]|nr:hypothetical protein ASG43_21605 [Aureimonas sp. Leaf454]
MQDKTHLPVAAALPDVVSFASIEARSLSGLADECARWLRNTSECHASIVTPAAKTLWAVLVQGEVDHVTETYDRLQLELSSRRRQGLCDA